MSIRYERRRRIGKQVGVIIDTINAVLATAIIGVAIAIAFNMDSNAFLFPVLFGLAALMNIVMGIKYYKRKELLRTITLLTAGILLIIITIVAYLTTWN